MALTSGAPASSRHFAILSSVLVLLCMSCRAQRSSTFYDELYPDALTVIRTSIRTVVSRERRMAASLIRLHFHDCFVQGYGASILLEKSPAISSERNAPPSKGPVRLRSDRRRQFASIKDLSRSRVLHGYRRDRSSRCFCCRWWSFLDGKARKRRLDQRKSVARVERSSIVPR